MVLYDAEGWDNAKHMSECSALEICKTISIRLSSRRNYWLNVGKIKSINIEKEPSVHVW